MSAVRNADRVELRLAGRDERWREVYTLVAVSGDARVLVWDGLSYEAARVAARTWEAGGAELVDLVAGGRAVAARLSETEGAHG